MLAVIFAAGDSASCGLLRFLKYKKAMAAPTTTTMPTMMAMSAGDKPFDALAGGAGFCLTSLTAGSAGLTGGSAGFTGAGEAGVLADELASLDGGRITVGGGGAPPVALAPWFAALGSSITVASDSEGALAGLLRATPDALAQRAISAASEPISGSSGCFCSILVDWSISVVRSSSLAGCSTLCRNARSASTSPVRSLPRRVSLAVFWMVDCNCANRDSFGYSANPPSTLVKAPS